MGHINSERKQIIKKVGKLSFKLALVVIDYLI